MREPSSSRSWLHSAADPIRIQILEALTTVKVATVAELASATNASSQTTRRHLDALLAAGLVEVEPGLSDGERQGRPASRYALHPELDASVRRIFRLTTASRTDAVEPRKEPALVRRLLDRVGAGVWILNGEGRTLFVNQTAADLAGRKASALVGVTINEVVEAYEDLATAFHATSGSDCRLRRPDGFEVWAEVHSQPTPEGAGPADGVVLTLTDVTIRRRRQIASARLAESNVMLRRFSELVSSESDPACSLQRGVSFLADELRLPLLATGLGARDERTVRTIVAAGRFYEANPLRWAGEVPVPRTGATMTSLRSGRAVVVGDYSRADQSGPVIDATPAMSSASIPVTERAWLTAFADTPGKLDEHVVSVLESAARLIPVT